MHDIDRDTLRQELQKLQLLHKEDDGQRKWYQFRGKKQMVSEEQEEAIIEAIEEAEEGNEKPVHAETEMLSAAPLKDYGAEKLKQELESLSDEAEEAEDDETDLNPEGTSAEIEPEEKEEESR